VVELPMLFAPRLGPPHIQALGERLATLGI